LIVCECVSVCVRACCFCLLVCSLKELELGHEIRDMTTEGLNQTIQIDGRVQMHLLVFPVCLENVRQIKDGTTVATVHLCIDEIYM